QWVRPGGDFWFEERRALLLSVVGRLKPGVTTSEAQAQMRTIAKQLEQAYPDVNKERSIALMSLEAAKSQALGGPNNEDLARNVSLLLVTASASILLIACANVANFCWRDPLPGNARWPFAWRLERDAGVSCDNCSPKAFCSAC